MVKKIIQHSSYRFMAGLGLLSVVSLSLLVGRILDSDSFRYGFLVWNLVLAIIPALVAWWLAVRIRLFGWLKWQQIVLTMLWIVFLPNSFYLVTDFIHLRANYEADLLFDVTLLMSFTFAGIMFGSVSVYILQRELTKRIRERYAYSVTGLLFLAVSFAICLGRYTRWNTWDIILQPAGLLYDVSDRFINPAVHIETYQTTGTLFLLLFSTYIVIWEAGRLLESKKR